MIRQPHGLEPRERETRTHRRLRVVIDTSGYAECINVTRTQVHESAPIAVNGAWRRVRYPTNMFVAHILRAVRFFPRSTTEQATLQTLALAHAPRWVPSTSAHVIADNHS